MAYLSCDWIEYTLGFGHLALRHCYKIHHGDKGFVPVCDYDGGPIPIDKVLDSREKLRYLNNRDIDNSPCKGCHCLEKGEWKKLKNNALFNKLTIDNFSICNLKCIYCFTVVHKDWNLPDYAYDLMPIFNYMLEKNLLQERSDIVWAGGEPTVLKDFDLFIDILQKAGHFNQVFTNSVVYSESIEEGLKNGLVGIVTSVDSGTPETFKALKGFDFYETVWTNIARYAQTGGNVSCNYIVKKENSTTEDINGFISRCKEIGVTSIGIMPDCNEVISASVCKEALNAAATLFKKAEKAGIFCDIQYHLFGANNSDIILDRLGGVSK